MNNMQYKVVDLFNNIQSVFTNDAYNLVHNSSINGVSMDFLTSDSTEVINYLINDLIKTNNQINSIIILIDNLVKNNIISVEIGSYILQNINIYDTRNQYIRK